MPEEIKDFDINPETGHMPDEFYEQEHRLALEHVARDIPKLLREPEAFLVGIQELYDDWDEEAACIQ